MNSWEEIIALTTCLWLILTGWSRDLHRQPRVSERIFGEDLWSSDSTARRASSESVSVVRRDGWLVVDRSEPPENVCHWLGQCIGIWEAPE